MIRKISSKLSIPHRLLALQFISDFGDQITASLIALSILDITQSTGQVGIVYLMTTLGFIFFTFVGGVLGDRWGRKKLLFGADFARGLVVLLMIVALAEKSMMVIYGASFVLSALGAIQRPVRLSAWAEAVPPKSLERYNSLLELSLQASGALGPLIAGFFAVRGLSGIGFSMDALTFFICAVGFSLLVCEAKKLTQGSTEKDDRKMLTGFRLIAHNAEVARYVLYDSLQMIGFGAFNATLVVLAQRDFGWSKTEYACHLAIIAWGAILGAFLGSLSAIEKINSQARLIASAIIPAISLACMLHVKTFPLCSLLFGVCFAFACLSMAITRTKVQAIARDHFPDHLASVIAARTIIIKIATLLGTAGCLFIDDFMSLDNTLMLFVIPIGASFLVLLGGERVPATQPVSLVARGMTRDVPSSLRALPKPRARN